MNDTVIRRKLLPEEKIASDDKSEEVEQKRNGEHLEVLGGYSNGVAKHVHLLVELQEFQELDGGEENDDSGHVAEELVVKGERLEVDELRWNDTEIRIYRFARVPVCDCMAISDNHTNIIGRSHVSCKNIFEAKNSISEEGNKGVEQQT